MHAVEAEQDETLSQRAQRLMSEAREAATGQVLLLEAALNSVHLLSSAVAEGGEIYPIGVRDLSRKISDDAAWCSQTITAIMKNTGHRKALVEGELPPIVLQEIDFDVADLEMDDEPRLAHAL